MPAILQPALYGLNQRWDVRRLEQVIVHLAANGLQCSIKIRIARKDKGRCLWLDAPHGAYNRKTISGLPNVQIRKQHIKSRVVHVFQGFWNGCCRSHFKPMLFKYRFQCIAYPRLVVDEQNPGRHFLLQQLGCFLNPYRWTCAKDIRGMTSSWMSSWQDLYCTKGPSSTDGPLL